MSKATKTNILFRVLLGLYILAIVYLCFGTFQDLPKISKTILGFETDKVVHFLMFLPLPFLMFFSYDFLTKMPWQSVLFAIVTFLAGCVIAAGTEIGQTYTATRHGDPMDFKADTLALAISSILVLIIDLGKQFRKPRERRHR